MVTRTLRGFSCLNSVSRELLCRADKTSRLRLACPDQILAVGHETVFFTVPGRDTGGRRYVSKSGVNEEQKNRAPKNSLHNENTHYWIGSAVPCEVGQCCAAFACRRKQWDGWENSISWPKE
jgi:hypothetical protein